MSTGVNNYFLIGTKEVGAMQGITRSLNQPRKNDKSIFQGWEAIPKQSSSFSTEPNCLKGGGGGGDHKMTQSSTLLTLLKFNSEFDGCNTPKMRSDQGASNTPDKKQWPTSFSFQISFFFNQSPIWPLTSAHYWAVGHMVGTRYTLGPLSSHQNTAYGELTCLTAHRSTRSTDPQVTANTTGTISKFDTAYQLIGTGVVPSVGLILSHATLHVSH